MKEGTQGHPLLGFLTAAGVLLSSLSWAGPDARPVTAELQLQGQRTQYKHASRATQSLQHIGVKFRLRIQPRQKNWQVAMDLRKSLFSPQVSTSTKEHQETLLIGWHAIRTRHLTLTLSAGWQNWALLPSSNTLTGFDRIYGATLEMRASFDLTPRDGQLTRRYIDLYGRAGLLGGQRVTKMDFGATVDMSERIRLSAEVLLFRFDDRKTSQLLRANGLQLGIGLRF